MTLAVQPTPFLPIPSGSKILVAVSGGPDSVALAHLLKGLPYSLVIGHVDHRLRRESAADAKFVKRLAEKWDIPFRVARVDVRRYAAQKKMGLEEAARTLRYQALAQMARQERCQAIATAHTEDDQAETVLMNFLRGAGPAGLAGMPMVRPIDKANLLLLVRPLLKVSKKELLAYLQQQGLRFRRDSTNASLQFTRNRIRHQALPYLEKFSPGLAGRLQQTAAIFRDEEEFWSDWFKREGRQTVRQKGLRFTVVLRRLLNYHKAFSRRILRHILPGSSFQDIEQVLQLAQSPQRTGWFKLSGSWQVRRDQETLVIVHKKRNG